ncbi:hypothetical protein DNTS_012241 [Danionella cerebrum]|uniref:Uncharacterized protein n=1 Tax=Danionella cerebrum TaxID=2873325 RepID=A0A553N292_9TELE|nr:hypothetical protein DNTS_012241 [Danionella translucida]
MKMSLQNYSVLQGGIPLHNTKENPVVLSMPEINDDLIFSTFNLSYCNHCCLGFAAFSNSVKARDRHMLGDYVSAREYGTRARRLNIAAIVIGFFFIILLIVIIIMSISEITSLFHHKG